MRHKWLNNKCIYCGLERQRIWPMGTLYSFDGFILDISDKAGECEPEIKIANIDEKNP